MKSIIKNVTIKKLFGIKNISTPFNSDVNIFIGANGTNKTTFLNLIEATLLVDISVLINIEFEEIILELQNENSYKKVSVVKRHEEFPVITYRFDEDNDLDLPYPEFIKRNYGRFPLQIREIHQNIKSKLDECVNLSWLSVHRDNNYMDDNDKGRERSKNFIDEKLSELMRKLTIYQLQLESEASKVADDFKERIFTLMLYNESYDKLDIKNVEQFNPNQIKNELFRCFNELGVNIRDKKDVIVAHTERLQEVIDRIKQPNISIEINDVFPLSLVNRTLSLISISKENEEEKQKIFNPILTYLKCLKLFMADKNFKLDKESSGELEVWLKDKKNKDNYIPLQLPSLSSGEKQLIILLTETLLQKKQTYLFIADEPELSLHIKWQRQIIESVRTLNENAQIIVATHSPEIAGLWDNYVINMENITSYGE